MCIRDRKLPAYLNLILRIGTLVDDPFGVTDKTNATEASVAEASRNSIVFKQSSGHNSAKVAKKLDKDYVVACSTLGENISEPLGLRALPTPVTK